MMNTWTWLCPPMLSMWEKRGADDEHVDMVVPVHVEKVGKGGAGIEISLSESDLSEPPPSPKRIKSPPQRVVEAQEPHREVIPRLGKRSGWISSLEGKSLFSRAVEAAEKVSDVAMDIVAASRIMCPMPKVAVSKLADFHICFCSHSFRRGWQLVQSLPINIMTMIPMDRPGDVCGSLV